MSVAESALPGIEPGRVERWLAEHVDGLAGPVEFGLVSGGRSNLTYRLTDAAGVNYALRRPPTGGVLSTAHDVSREWRFISALAPTAVPVPPPVAYCADSTVTGAEFYVMGFVEGLVLADRAAGLALAPQARAGAAEHLVDVLVALHALDPVVVGLGDMVRKTGYVERQLRRWHAQVHATGAPELALLDEVHDLLARRVPAQSGGIVHGDYRAGNVAFGPDGAVRAVFDWELATTGDPMADLGWLASTWQDPGEQLPPTTPGPSTVAGFPARAQLVRRYARLSGRDVSNLPYWVAFSRWRSACIGVGVRARYLAGHMADDGFAAGLLTSAEPGAAGGRVVLAEAARDALRAGGLLLLLSRQLRRSEGMAWDFSTDPEFQGKLDWVERFCQEKVEPLDYVFPHAVRWPDPVVKAYVRELQQEVKDQGLWAIFLDRELGGPGFGQLRLALLNEVIGRYAGAPSMFGASAPDTGNMEILAAYGTEEQKKRWLEPLLNQDMFSAFSMTEPQGGSDPNLFKTHAVQDGDAWVINGEKWFTSAGRIADLLFVMCTNGMFVVPRTTPGVEIMPEPRNHNHIVYTDVRVPLDHLLGPENGAKVLAQRRLGGGRIHHAMRTIAQCKLAFDMMCERALSRESHGRIIAEHQMVQEKIAESYAAITMLRLFVLETAWKIDQTSTLEARTDIAAVKFTMAKVLREVSYNALHILGSLGTTDLTPIQAMYASAPAMGIADGVDEVHKATVARRVLRGYRPHEGYWPTEYIPAKREEAWRRMRPVLDARPDLARVAEEHSATRR